MTETETEAMKHAIVKRDGYEVPLIGIPFSSALETCDLCGDEKPLWDIAITGTQFLCRHCASCGR